METTAAPRDVTERSPEISELAKALAAAQAEIAPAKKDSVNPHFGKSYADLASVWEACRAPLTRHGIAVVQMPISEASRVGVTTVLMHTSGQFIQATCWAAPERPGPQALGSCLTYLRRYALSAFVGVAPDDDDGEGAEGRAGGNAAAPPRRASRAAPPPPANANGASKPAAAAPPSGDRPTSDLLNEIVAMLKGLGWPKPHISQWLQKHAGVQTVGALTAAQANEVRGLLSDALDKQAAEASAGGAS